MNAQVTNQAATTTAKPETKPELDKNLVAEVKKLPSMSAKIRFLNSKGMERGAISKFLSETEGKHVRYQWVRNVLITPVRKPKDVKEQKAA